MTAGHGSLYARSHVGMAAGVVLFVLLIAISAPVQGDTVDTTFGIVMMGALLLLLDIQARRQDDENTDL